MWDSRHHAVLDRFCNHDLAAAAIINVAALHQALTAASMFLLQDASSQQGAMAGCMQVRRI
jgi:hypothetical protein